MPELPEIETIRRGLSPHVTLKRIQSVKVSAPTSVRNSQSDFTRTLTGDAFAKIERRGKLLVFPLAHSPRLLLVHLKMTGQLLYRPSSEASTTIAGGHSFTEHERELPGKFTRIELGFEDGSQLFFNDMRRFGYWQVVSPSSYAEIEARYGIEPGMANFTRENFVKIMQSNRTVKAVLLDQSKVAGLGNIYVDEACFRARVLPSRSVKTLVKKEVEALFDAIQTVIAAAIEGRGTSFRDYRDSEGQRGDFQRQLLVYAREGERCVQCGNPIQKVKQAGRGTHFCPSCQQ